MPPRDAHATQSHRFAVAGGEYAVWVRGAGPSTLLLHGWPVTSHHWRHTVAALVMAQRRAISVDLLGLGESRHTSGVLEKRRIAADLLALMDTFAAEAPRFSVVGHDWGGSVALAMAALAPARVTHLIVAEEIPPGLPASIPEPGRSRYPSWHGGFHRAAGLAEALLADRTDPYISYFLSLRADPATLSAADLDLYLASYRSAAATAAGLGYYRTAAADATFFGALATAPLALPCLTVGGRLAMGDAVGDSLRPAVRRLSHITLERCGHYPAEEQPEAFNSSLCAFLE